MLTEREKVILIDWDGESLEEGEKAGKKRADERNVRDGERMGRRGLYRSLPEKSQQLFIDNDELWERT